MSATNGVPSVHTPTQNGNGNVARRGQKRRFTEVLPRIHLPIDDVEQQIMELISEYGTSIIIGETGSGKSTQIPQLCLKTGLNKKGKIAVTQPRRVAAISLATRVSDELGTELGQKVGYHVRFEKAICDSTKICYLTDGILLREALHDSLLKDYSTILVDEAHERSLHTDVLLSILYLCYKQRKNTDSPLKLIIMSATMQADLFSKFLDAPVYVIKGRTFPVEIFYSRSIDPASSDYVYNSIICVKDIHLHEPLTDDILVFLTGREEIEVAAKKLKQLNKEFEHPIYVSPLYAAMSSAQQMRAFQPAPEGHRKVVLATNIAETSLTIPGIRIVVDSGKVKTRTFTARDRIDVLRVQSTSQAQAIQRAGRAGREAPGKCYRLYPEPHFHKMKPATVPEILRCNLSAVLLELISMGLKRPKKLKLIEKPEDDAIKAAIDELMALEAVISSDDVFRLSPIGKSMCTFPLDPQQSRVLLWANNLGCLEEVLTVVAILSGETIFDSDIKGTADEIEKARRRFSTQEGDHLTALNAFQAFKMERKKNKGQLKEWCNANFLNHKNLEMIVKIRKQLLEIAQHQDMSVTSCGANRDKVRQALACGMFMNVCEYDRQEDRYKLVIQPGTTLKIHPSSCIAQSRPRYLVFTELIRTADLYARDVSLIDDDWVRPIIEKYKQSRRKV